MGTGLSVAAGETRMTTVIPAPETITVVGGGYVGVVTAAVLAMQGYPVTVVETDPTRRLELEHGRPPICEPGLDSVLAQACASGRLSVSDDLGRALETTTLVVIAVGTPERENGQVDLTALDAVVAEVAEMARAGTVVAIKSTVPPGTTARVEHQLAQRATPLAVVSCPEFTREGNALADLRAAPRVVVGGRDRAAMDRVWKVMRVKGARCVFCDPTEAELIKYGSNAFLALKISFINEVANLCEAFGGQIDAVAEGIGLDPRVSPAFLGAGVGFGGSCFPKDVRALEAAAHQHGQRLRLLQAALEVNHDQRVRFVEKVREAVGGSLRQSRVAVLGLAFKPGTDDLRHAPSLAIIHQLVELGAEVVGFDPVAVEGARGLLPGVALANDPYAAIAGADVVAVVTEWPQIVGIDWARAARLVRHRSIVDGRNCLDADALMRHGFNYHGMGRSSRIAWRRASAAPTPPAVRPKRKVA